MPQFEFNKVYVREIIEEEHFYTEFLFLHPTGNSYMMYNFRGFFIVNRGSTFSIDSFNELHFPGVADPSAPFNAIGYYYNANESYLLLQEGIMKLHDAFNTAYGHPTTLISLITPSHDETMYSALQQEIKRFLKEDIVDWRFL
jgi:hypothetical protein